MLPTCPPPFPPCAVEAVVAEDTVPDCCAETGVTIGARAKVAAGTPAYKDVAEGATLSPFGILRT